MGEVIKFPEKPQEHVASVAFGGVWTCGCDSQEWRLYGNGIVLCTGCNYISTVLAVIQSPVSPNPPAQGKEEQRG